MTTLELENQPAVSRVSFDDGHFVVSLADGRALVIPLSWYPRLEHGSERERADWRLLGAGEAIEWPQLDEHIGVDGLLAGRRSAESPASLQHWLSSRR